MSNEQIEKRIEELEQAVNQLAESQTMLAEAISHLSEAQDVTTSNSNKKSNDYTEVIMYLVAILVFGGILLSYMDNLIKMIDKGNQTIQRSVKSSILSQPIEKSPIR